MVFLGPSELPHIARTAGRVVGMAVRTIKQTRETAANLLKQSGNVSQVILLSFVPSG